MDELINQVVQRTGIPQDKAKMAVEVVVNYLKGKVPGPLAGQIDSALSGGGAGAGGALGNLGV